MLDPILTFDNFVCGKANEGAYTAAVSVTESPGSGPYLFFVHGVAGTGKTHLIQAIGHRLLSTRPAHRVLYQRAEDFCADAVRAIRSESLAAFRQRYESLDALILDDIQFLAYRELAQEGLVHVIDGLVGARRQVILAGNAWPDASAGYGEHLLSRISRGRAVTLEPPEMALRVAILHTKAGQLGKTLDTALALRLAEKYPGSVRALEDVLPRAIALAASEPSAIPVERVDGILRTLVAEEVRQASIRAIHASVAEFYGKRVAESAGSGAT
jgi:chromosomal replication initiator protein